MADNPILDLTTPEIKSHVYVKSNVNGWFFDAFLKMTHTSTLTITDSPVESGTSVADNAFLQPRKLTIEVGMTDVAKSFIPGQFAGSGSRSVRAYKILRELQALRVPLQVVTRLGVYENLLIEVLSAPDDYTTHHGLRCTVTFREIIVAKLKTVKISANPAVTNHQNRGHLEPVQANTSMIQNIRQKLNGG